MRGGYRDTIRYPERVTKEGDSSVWHEEIAGALGVRKVTS